MFISAALATSVMSVGSVVIAAASDPGLNNPFTYLTGLGFPGVIIGLFITGQIRPKSEVEYLRSELDASRKAQKELFDVVTKEAIPAMTRSTQVIEALPENEAATARQLTQALDKLANITNSLEESNRGPRPGPSRY